MPRAIALAILMAGATARAGSPSRFESEPDQALATLLLAVGEQQIAVTSSSLEWSMALFGDGSAQVRLRIPIESLKSGHPEVDAALRRWLRADEHPALEIEGTARPARATAPLDGTVALCGTARPLRTPLTAARFGPMVALRASFTIDLDAFGIERLRVGGVPVERSVEVTVAARLRASPASVMAGGVVRRSR